MSTLARVIFDPDTTPPSVPSSVAASAQSQTTIRVTWAASTDTGGSGLAGYRVYRSTTSGGTYAQVGSDLSVASLSFDDTSLSSGQTRYYRVTAVDGRGNESTRSAIVSATTQAVPGGAILFRKDYSVSAAPIANMGPSDNYPVQPAFPGHAIIEHRVDGWAPGRNCYRLRFPRISDVAREFTCGWEKVTTGLTTFGSEQYIRWRLRYTPETNFISATPGTYYNKILVVHPYVETSRMLLQTYINNNPAAPRYGFTMQMDGGGYSTSIGDNHSTPFAPGQVVNIQIRLRWSSAQGASNALYRVWFNNGVEASPTLQMSNIIINANSGPNASMNYLLGSYLNHATGAGGIIEYDETDYEVGTAFDPNWHLG
jgi:hypothetical protein